jgi:nicotinamide-nucleotide amidase
MQEVVNFIGKIGELLTERGWYLCTAESCTGGLVAHLLTNVSGSSRWFAGGLVAYSNQIKQHLLGVELKMLQEQGAVSKEVVEAMAVGSNSTFSAQVSIALSGIAGPTGGTLEKPVGTVWIGWSLPAQVSSAQFSFTGNRIEVKEQSAYQAIEGLLGLLNKD